MLHLWDALLEVVTLEGHFPLHILYFFRVFKNA